MNLKIQNEYPDWSKCYEYAINLTTDVGTTETIVINNKKGINEAAIKIEATKGGIDIDAEHGKNINISGGQILISSKTDEENNNNNFFDSNVQASPHP